MGKFFIFNNKDAEKNNKLIIRLLISCLLKNFAVRQNKNDRFSLIFLT